MQDCILTVCCLTYNHEKYIRKTLEGFVNQNTTYKYQVLVHDDASTDGTQDIIREYAQRYPDLIKPILQTQNQYSQKVRIYDTFMRPLVTSKYTAMCEGDDYWCDPQKLQLQIDYMEQHPQCNFCVHNTQMMQEDGTPKNAYFNYAGTDRDYTAEDVIAAGGGGLFHTSSFVFQTQHRHDRPADFTIAGIGDYPLSIYLSTRGTVHYIDRVMSMYRVGSSGSWVKKNSATSEKVLARSNLEVQELDKLDRMTGHKYTAAFQTAKNRTMYRCYLKCGMLGHIFKSPALRAMFNQNSLKQKVKLIVKAILKR